MDKLLKIEHKSVYHYEEQVTLGPHDILMFPQHRSYIKILRSSLKVSPSPQGKYERINAEGNTYYNIWFQNDTQKLEIISSISVKLLPFNPFGFILKKGLEFPFSLFEYDNRELPALRPYLILDNDSNFMLEYVDLQMNCSTDLVSFLTNLVASIKSKWNHVLREEEGILSLRSVFASKSGSCRDLSWMLMQMLRTKGLASRFVSGYAYNPELDTGHELHAWVEVYLPGAGWIGLDPSLGLFTDEFYIALACSHDPLLTMPIYGSYSGSKSSKLKTEVNIYHI
ncbi:transglutaminase N-terminal domain-containing protein [Belliella kenyensis]|uniref:Transglutaminase N-terminal domain-containing protein n=1 Tax=Belliella kenyensis TaxID=1472724 RepID=A0ABV8EKL0_9BACT|nr:transglutaminase family protein [Belliella kenyensis]MCH7400479.1 transglutaminase family protein [Belliella kenyensis]MDN3604505.1 transglutaminase family protein [Belliella kenyensis]